MLQYRRPRGRQAQADTAGMLVARALDAEERREHLLLIVRRNAWPAVDDADLDAIGEGLQTNAGLAAIFDRVVDQVGQRTLDPDGPADIDKTLRAFERHFGAGVPEVVDD